VTTLPLTASGVTGASKGEKMIPVIRKKHKISQSYFNKILTILGKNRLVTHAGNCQI
jgi:DNA-binding IscR family transcriptional regulator